ncbi:AraC family transcriptional regulator [Mucilaginibacter frigoritolerans]|nr:helix-turn-helix transcriptional regulator [Mucilaginibacter frigoritolerans]
MPDQISIKDKSEGAKHIKITPFRSGVRKTTPHKHNNYFEIVYLSAGKGQHLIDHQQYEVAPPVIFFIRREQIHGFDLHQDIEPTGFVLIVKKLFINNSFDGELKALFSKASNHTCLYLDKVDTIQQLFELLVKENETGSLPVIEGLLKALLAKILQAAQPTSKSVTTKKTDLYQHYLELLSTNKPVKNQVAHYAGLLNTTPQNLNAICRKAANQTAAGLLAEFIISEARRLLLYTHNTVAETAFALDFKDTSHFIKYFKRFTGLTPQAYRNIP